MTMNRMGGAITLLLYYTIRRSSHRDAATIWEKIYEHQPYGRQARVVIDAG